MKEKWFLHKQNKKDFIDKA